MILFIFEVGYENTNIFVKRAKDFFKNCERSFFQRFEECFFFYYLREKHLMNFAKF